MVHGERNRRQRLKIDGEAVTTNRDFVVADAALSAAGMVVVGNEFGGDGRCPAPWFSADGTSWERPDPATTLEGELVSVTAAGTGFIAVDHTSEDDTVAPLLLLSGDARSWFEAAPGAFAVEGASRVTLTALGVYLGTVVVAGVASYPDYSDRVLLWSGALVPVGG